MFSTETSAPVRLPVSSLSVEQQMTALKAETDPVEKARKKEELRERINAQARVNKAVKRGGGGDLLRELLRMAAAAEPKLKPARLQMRELILAARDELLTK